MNSVMPAVLVTNSPDELLQRMIGRYVTKTITLGGGAGAKIYQCFTFTGIVEIWGLYGVVMTVTNMAQARTVSFQWGVAGAAAGDITLAAGTDCSGADVGSFIAKKLVAASAVDFVDASTGGVVENARDATLKCFTLVEKTGSVNYILFLVDQNADTAATIKIDAFWSPRSATGSVVPA